MKDIVITITPERIRQIGTRRRIEPLTTQVAEAFLLVHGAELKDALERYLSVFVQEKLQ